MTSAGVLAGRIAAALVHHEPGWRLPRLTTLARRYQASTLEIEAAVDDLVNRHLVRRLPDGQLYRASPAEYRLTLEGISGLASHVDPMGGELACTSRHATRRRVPEDIGRALGLAPGEPVLAIKCLWAVGGEPGALSASYVPEQFAEELDKTALTAGLSGRPTALAAPPAGPAPFLFAFPLQLRPAAVGARPTALQIEMGPPPPAAGRRLRVPAGGPVITVTASFAGQHDGLRVALTMAMLRPELFRIVVEAAPVPRPGDGTAGLTTAWTHDGQCWES